MIGKKLSPYRIIVKPAEGEMGIVHKYRGLTLKRIFSLKFLPHELTHDTKAKTRFIQEDQAASALQHINVANIHDIDETEDGRIFIVIDSKIEYLKKFMNQSRCL